MVSEDQALQVEIVALAVIQRSLGEVKQTYSLKGKELEEALALFRTVASSLRFDTGCFRAQSYISV